MNLKILLSTICLTSFSLYLGNSARAQQLSNSTTWSRQQQLPSTSESVRSLSQFERLLQRQLQQKSPLFYLLLFELEQYQLREQPDLQQQAEAEILEMLQRPKPLQQRLLQQQ